MNCTEKPMIPILDETVYHHIQIIGPPTPLAAVFLLLGIEKFQLGTLYVERSCEVLRLNERLLGHLPAVQPSAVPSPAAV